VLPTLKSVILGNQKTPAKLTFVNKKASTVLFQNQLLLIAKLVSQLQKVNTYSKKLSPVNVAQFVGTCHAKLVMTNLPVQFSKSQLVTNVNANRWTVLLS
jgi:hypothetical protein